MRFFFHALTHPKRTWRIFSKLTKKNINTNVIEREKRSKRREKMHTLTVRFTVITVVRHQFASELPSSPEEKGDIINNIVFIRK